MGNRILAARGRHLEEGLGPRFRAFFWGQAISQVGDYVAYLSLPLYVAFLTESTFSLAVTYSLETVPALLLGLVGGVLLDRLPLRSVMIVSDLVRAGAFFALGAIALDPAPSGLYLVFLLAFVLGSFSSIFQGGMFAVIPRSYRPSTSPWPTAALPPANSSPWWSGRYLRAASPVPSGSLRDSFSTVSRFLSPRCRCS